TCVHVEGACKEVCCIAVRRSLERTFPSRAEALECLVRELRFQPMVGEDGVGPPRIIGDPFECHGCPVMELGSSLQLNPPMDRLPQLVVGEAEPSIARFFENTPLEKLLDERCAFGDRIDHRDEHLTVEVASQTCRGLGEVDCPGRQMCETSLDEIA